MIKDITFGQYFESNSFLHRLDPRTKLILLILYIVFIFLCKDLYSLLFLTAVFFAVIFISKVPITMYLKNLKSILPIVIFTGLINLFYNDSGKTLFNIFKLKVTTGGIYQASFMSLRIFLLILISSVLTYTTTPNDLTDAIENLLKPLSFIGLSVAVHTLAMMMTIALRFIPTLVEETQKIMNAQKARGADLESGKFKERLKALIPILIPLLISSVRRAYELAEAMECRCYNGGVGRVRMKRLKYSFTDLIALVFSLVSCAAVIIINIKV